MHYARTTRLFRNPDSHERPPLARVRGHNHAVAKVSFRALHPACGSTSGRTRALVVVKKKNMDVSHPGFKRTPWAPGAT